MEILKFWAEQLFLGAQWGVHSLLWLIVWFITAMVTIGLGIWNTSIVLEEIQYDFCEISFGKVVRQALLSLAFWPLFVLWSHCAVSPISTGHLLQTGSPSAYWAVWGYPAAVFGIPIVMAGVATILSEVE